MKRVVVMVGLWVLLLVLQLSFLASLPAPWLFIPIVAAASIYLVQHHGLLTAAWWLPAYGFFLDLFHIGTVPWETVIYSIAGVFTVLLARRIFSNRSLYGIAACGILILGTILLLEAIAQFWQARADILLSDLLWDDLWQLLFLIITLIILFMVAPRLRNWIRLYERL